MFPTKAGGVLFAVFATIGAVLFFHLSSAIEERTVEDIGDRLRVAQRAVDGARRLNDFALSARTAEVAATGELAAALATPRDTLKGPEGAPLSDDDFRYRIHQQGNEIVATWQARFTALAEGKEKPRSISADWRREKPDLFYILDKDGVGVARSDDKAWFGPQEANVAAEFPIVKQVLGSGVATNDIWLVREAPMNVAIEPVRSAGVVVGAVVLGTRLTDAEAKKDQVAGYDVAYFLGDRIRKSSTLDTAKETELSKIVGERKLFDHDGRTTLLFELGGAPYLGLVGKLDGHPTAPQAGFVVFANAASARSRALEGVALIPLLCLAGFLLASGLLMLFFRQFLAPFNDIDQGVVEIINGNLDRWFEGPPKHPAAAMSQNLNVMVCQLSGRPLPEDEEETTPGQARRPHGETWAEDRMFIEELNPSEFGARPIDPANASGADAGLGVPSDANSQSGLAPDILRLIRETEDTYKKRLFREYTEALRAAGEPVQGITFEKFHATIQSNAEILREKYGCSRVRFLVQTRDGKVSLKSIPIK